MNRPVNGIATYRQLDTFFARLADAPQRALLLDYDGALAPRHVEPKRAMPYPGLRPQLDELHAAGHTRLVIITGRYTRDLLPLLGMQDPPEIWGSYGWERRQMDGRTEIGRMPPRALQGLAEADDWVEANLLEDRREVKPGCLALHLTGLDSQETADLRALVLEQWQDIAWRYGLDLLESDNGVELRVPGRTKGGVVRRIVSEMPAGAAIAFLGEDHRDEEGFEALAGRGLSILVRPEPRPTAADVWLRPPRGAAGLPPPLARDGIAARSPLNGTVTAEDSASPGCHAFASAKQIRPQHPGDRVKSVTHP